jgi:hypothetical protein
MKSIEDKLEDIALEFACSTRTLETRYFSYDLYEITSWHIIDMLKAAYYAGMNDR